jgi:hypothetical protein
VAQTIFVFGSNLAGRHGKGAALTARQHWGAVPGCGEGPQGSAYAIPVKDGRNKANLRDPAQTLPLSNIAMHVALFLRYARSRPDLTFTLAEIGCGLAGYTPAQIAPLFAPIPDNCILPPSFAAVLRA